MSLTLFFQKLWLYSGLFYCSLVFFVIYCCFRKFKKHSKAIIYSALIINLLFGLRFYLNSFKNLNRDWQEFLLTSEEKMDLASSKQYSFLRQIEELLPVKKNICYPWPSDIAGRYARQFFYPREIRLGEKDISQCDFLVLDYSLGKKDYEIGREINNRKDQLIFDNKLGKVFKIGDFE